MTSTSKRNSDVLVPIGTLIVESMIFGGKKRYIYHLVVRRAYHAHTISSGSDANFLWETYLPSELAYYEQFPETYKVILP